MRVWIKQSRGFLFKQSRNCTICKRMIPAAKADKKQEVLNKSVQSSITFDDETSISIKPMRASFGSQNKTTTLG